MEFSSIISSTVKDNIPSAPIYKIHEWITEKYVDRAIIFDGLSRNKHPGIIPILNDFDISKLNLTVFYFNNLSANPYAIDFIKKYIDNPEHNYKFSWDLLSGNPAAIDLLRANPEKIDWKMLSGNPAALDLLRANPEKINLDKLCLCNTNAIDIIEKNIDIILSNQATFNKLSSNPSAIKIIEKYDYKINHWSRLCSNPAAVHIIEANIDKIKDDIYAWSELSRNTNPKAIKILYFNKEKIDWWRLSENPAAIKLLEQNPEKTYWQNLYSNPAIFEKIYTVTSLNPANFRRL